VYFSGMKKQVVVGAFLGAGLLAAVNNLVSKRSIPWIGGPEVLDKPSGWPSEGLLKGFFAGLKVASKGSQDHFVLILAGFIGLFIVIFFLKKFRGVSPSSIVLTFLRLGLAAMFLAAAYPKFTDPKGFSILVAQYQFLPHLLVNPFSLALAAFEIVVGLGLILTAWEKEFSALIGLLLLMFIVALSQALYRDLGIACGCFDIEGAANIGETWFSLIRDIVLMPLVVWMAISGGNRFIWQSHSRNVS
jgi:uncharacterized membrane protein YphA (DoxX/SURF4 family)